METTRLAIGYAEWAIVVGLTILLFTYFSTKYKSFWRLALLVLLPVWIVTGGIKGVEKMYFDNSTDLLSIEGFAYLLAETLPVILIFGGITFGLKFNKLRKNIIN